MTTEIEKLEKIINDFTVQEIGNRVSEFSMIGLKLILVNTLFPKEVKTGEPNKE